MGESAGGGHAAMLAMAARDRGEVPIMYHRRWSTPCSTTAQAARAPARPRSVRFSGAPLTTGSAGHLCWAFRRDRRTRPRGCPSPCRKLERSAAHLHRRGVNRPVRGLRHRLWAPADRDRCSDGTTRLSGLLPRLQRLSDRHYPSVQ